VSASTKHVTVSPEPEFLAGIRKSDLPEILGAAKIRNIGPRHIILKEGNPAAHLFLLKSGLVRFYRLTRNGDLVLLWRIVPGEVFGLGTLLSTPTSYIGTAETVRDSELLVWEYSQIQGLARKYPRLAQNALSIVLRYLAAHSDRLFDLVTCTAAERLARALLHLKPENVVPTGVEIAATNEDLSALANVSTFTVSRLLNRWAREGVLAKSRGKIFIPSPEKLIFD
jgi:CRP-like cAMP-binding protein